MGVRWSYRIDPLTRAVDGGEGIAALQLTMRRLGAELGVDPMTIYGHVPDKTALFDGLAELVLAEITLPRRTGEWTHDFRAVARAARATLLAHPHLIPLLGTRPSGLTQGSRVRASCSGPGRS